MVLNRIILPQRQKTKKTIHREKITNPENKVVVIVAALKKKQLINIDLSTGTNAEVHPLLRKKKKLRQKRPQKMNNTPLNHM